MFPRLKHMFQHRKHVCTGRKLMCNARKHKIPGRKNTFFSPYSKIFSKIFLFLFAKHTKTTIFLFVLRLAYSSASEHWKVVPLEMSPVSRPSLNHFMRCLEVPWLNDSGTA